jgi:hypothetical protein
VGLGPVPGPRGFDPEIDRPVKATRAGALRAALTAGRSPGISRGMNDPETHPAKKPDLAALRARVRAWLDAKAKERAARPPVSPAPLYDELYFRGTTWLDSLSYTDDWSDCLPEPTLPGEGTK